MCAITGMFTERPNVCLSIYNALTVLQHRGQDAAGMATCDDNGVLKMHKDNGLVRDVFDEKNMMHLTGQYGLGHTRYPTAGSSSNSEAQPFYVNSPFGLVLAHNGNLVNASELSDELYKNDLRHLNTKSDSEVLLNIFAHALHKRVKNNLKVEDIFSAVDELHDRVKGAYAVIIMILGYGILAFRDPHGIRPLVYGQKKDKNHMFSSESVALDCLGYNQNVRDLAPGESIFIDNKGQKNTHIYRKANKVSPCIFEYVYLARPDSTMDSINVYKSRLSMGKYLANKIRKELTDQELKDIDVVIPIPDTSRTSALPISIDLNKKLREGFVKNRYIGRTFIMPGQKVRKKSVKQKLNTVSSVFKNKNVLLIDDSIVRGNTSKQIVQMAREAGAKKVIFASASPPIIYPNVYGIDMPYVKELIAYNKTNDEICNEMGADKLIYQNLDDLIAAVKESNVGIESFDTSCFDGKYITEGVTSEYLNNLHNFRGNNK
ncbi:MAG: amidophosphoribosyltransferase [Candidatus Marinimicrobia bacterium]|nr:amidophosphoribosyltransferase [Candidatus Neomarinimicrobiota bacterium]|tara:strand:+ start:929 stop:2395 length:1467 start_codon:yes stop_codon:yes gene_type:complete